MTSSGWIEPTASSVSATRWKLPTASRRSREIKVELLHLPSGENVRVDASWRWSTPDSRGLPFSRSRCHARFRFRAGSGDCEIETLGAGESWFAPRASGIAFAEAWERAVMKACRCGLLRTASAVTSSNGFAAGVDGGDACERALAELEERAVLLHCWRETKGWRPVRPRSLTATILARALANRGWRVRLFRLSAGAAWEVLAGLLTHPERGARFDSLSPAQPDTTETKLLLSLSRSGASKAVEPIRELPARGRPQDHLRYYASPENLAAFQFLERNPAPCPPLPNEDDTQIELHFSAGAFPAVARAWNPAWPELAWGLQSIAGKNPWPHPLA